ncbi:MAG: hypothetical protein EZS28_047381, partial [Streblomastix strix]
DIQAQRSYVLRQVGLRSNGDHHRRFGDGLLNVNAFIQRHAKHEYLTISEWKSFWREVDTDLYLDTKDRKDRIDQFDLERGRKRRRVISNEGSGNGQNNDDLSEGLHSEIERQQLRQFRIRRNRREQARPPVQTAIGAPVYIPGIRAVQEEVFRVENNISPNLDEESTVSWTSAESINQERNTPIVNLRSAQQLLAAQDNQEQLNQQIIDRCYRSGVEHSAVDRGHPKK